MWECVGKGVTEESGHKKRSLKVLVGLHSAFWFSGMAVPEEEQKNENLIAFPTDNSEIGDRGDVRKPSRMKIEVEGGHW